MKMIVNVVGYKVCDFKDREGKAVKGVSLKCLTEPTDTDFVGMDIMKVWLSENLVNNIGFVPEVGKQIDLHYDFDGHKAFLSSYSKVE